MLVYKLTDENMRTHGGFQYELGVVAKASGSGGLCSDGFLHWYHSPLLAVLLNPLHARIVNPRLFLADAEGETEYDRGLKGGSKELTLLEEIPVPEFTPSQRATFARLCADWAKSAAKQPRMKPEKIAEALHELAEKALKSE
jgi:hypothetical protein